MNEEKKEKFVFLTNSSFKQLTRYSNTRTYDEKVALEIFKSYYDNWKFYKMFNKNDIKFLYKQFLLLSGESENVFYNEVKDRKDDLKYILELKGKLKYHLFPDCIGLNRGFRNFFVPEPIARIEDLNSRLMLIQEIRDWFKINNYTIDSYIEGKINDKTLTIAFNSYFPIKFQIEPITISQSDKNQFKWYIEMESGSVKVEKGYSMEDFLKNVSIIISDRNNLCRLSKQLYNLSKFDYLISKPLDEIKISLKESITNGFLKDVDDSFLIGFGWNNLNQFWKDHINIKNRAKFEFTELLKWKFNLPDNSLKNITLEDFNFECCNLCQEKNIITI